jgi:hypothetical protein
VDMAEAAGDAVAVTGAAVAAAGIDFSRALQYSIVATGRILGDQLWLV